ncbi:hypothetical protein POM88_035211 [Heracleum sosnowskyi]|uniref:TF-B3 domain-containing protein n=1 Tax=Heracleum sosnowskyi TaxID=360622 RepID=A0AAD8HML9_9APIA|nr:hypothetical protein POM88_035211 [Heracleum sosnowskyi]
MSGFSYDRTNTTAHLRSGLAYFFSSRTFSLAPFFTQQAFYMHILYIIFDLGCFFVSSSQMIPRKFMTAYGDDLVDFIFLEAPAGSIWQVKLERSNSEVWLQNGWPDFAAHYSICSGHLLVFRYEGNSHFHVIILDKSATEVEYPLSATSQSENTYLGTGFGKRKEVTNDGIGRKEDFINYVALSAQYTETVSACAKASHQVNKKTVQVTTDAKHDRALESATAFQSTNPFFEIKMSPSYVSGRSLSVPRKFFTTYITQNHCNVILQLSQGKTWPLNCRISRRAAKLSSGWNLFAQENSLVVGDVCVFELINCSKRLFSVSIFR